MRKLVLTLSLSIALPLLVSAAGDVDMLTQGKTYTPPFYEGRSLWSNETNMTITAVPHIGSGGAETDPSKLIYRWSQDGAVLGSLSGLNKRTLTISDTVLSQPTRIRVEVLPAPDSPDILASATMTFAPGAVKLLAYEASPLYGLMLHRAVADTFSLTEPEVTFSAFPLFAGVSARTAGIVYTWTTNNSDTRTGNKATYRAPEGSNGSSQITLEAAAKALAQPFPKDFLVQFGNQNAL